jgi:hypothetical protein
MNKRSALFVAGGLVVTMLVAASAILMGMTGPSSAHADVVRSRHNRKPIVKTIKRTVTIHEPALSPSTFTGGASGTAPGSTEPRDDRTAAAGEPDDRSFTAPPASPTPGYGGDDGDGSPSGSGSPGPGWGGDD